MPKYTTSEQRLQMIQMYEQGLPLRAIAATLHVGLATVYLWISRYLQDASLATKLKRGRQRKTTVNFDRNIIHLSETNPFLSALDIKRQLQLNVCPQTIRNRLYENGLHGRISAGKHSLTVAHKLARLEFALQYCNWTFTQWSTVIFLDEKVFMSSGNGPPFVWRPVNKRFDSKYIFNHRRSGRFAISVWGCLTSHEVGFLHWIPRRLNQHYYMKQILKRYIPIGDDSVYFMHDRSSIHEAHSVRDWLNARNIRVLPWPPKGADMNPIENVWAEIERLTVNRTPASREELWHIVRDTWHFSISQDYVETLIRSLPKRLEKVIETGGQWTKY